MYSKDSLNEEKKMYCSDGLHQCKDEYENQFSVYFVTKSTINTNVYMSTDRTNFCKTVARKSEYNPQDLSVIY
jgi:hypothetical protein